MSTVRTFLDLSTGHLTVETRALLDSKDAPVPVHRNEHGWLAWVPTDEANLQDTFYYPADLVACFKHARALGCDYILFDCDAERDDALDWLEPGEEEKANG